MSTGDIAHRPSQVLHPNLRRRFAPQVLQRISHRRRYAAHNVIDAQNGDQLLFDENSWTLAAKHLR